jgi:hypothetical protein
VSTHGADVRRPVRDRGQDSTDGEPDAATGTVGGDRVGDVLLVELAIGRSWPVDRGRLLAWWPAA